MRNRSMSASVFGVLRLDEGVAGPALKLHDLVVIHSVHRRFSAHHGDGARGKASASPGRTLYHTSHTSPHRKPCARPRS